MTDSYHQAKADKDKPRFSLLEVGHLQEMIEVLEFGAKKYSKDSWKSVPDAKERYFDAAMRHLLAYRQGQETDVDSGLRHLAHAAVNIMFLWEKNESHT